MLRGLEEVQRDLQALNVPFYLVAGFPEEEIPNFVNKFHINTLVTDFDPLHVKTKWKQAVSERVDIPFLEVDAHNIIPCWLASKKKEYAAYTIRPKIYKAMGEFLEDFPPLERHPTAWREKTVGPDRRTLAQTLTVDRNVSEVQWIKPGEKASKAALDDCLEHRLGLYDEFRNDPLRHGQSSLSPYLHFGQLSAQRVALEVVGSDAKKVPKAAFLEEVIVRRELSDNFCFYSPHYDGVEGFPDWSRETLLKHERDKRSHQYSLEEFDHASTHDDLWNAAQTETATTGKMHGYLRMYWAKKILEWTKSAEEALHIAIYLNDRCEIDGRDPNGYAGIAWSIGGVHDRAWAEREVFGKIRYMSYSGCRSKFNVDAYIKHVARLNDV